MTQVVERVPFDLNPPQARFWLSDARYVDLEGGVRSGKTTVAVLKLLHLLQEHPGLNALAARWTQDATEVTWDQMMRKRETLAADVRGLKES